MHALDHYPMPSPAAIKQALQQLAHFYAQATSTVCHQQEPIVFYAAGRNIHALDPYRMPSQAALERGSAAARGILKAHRDANAGSYPETVAVRSASDAGILLLRSGPCASCWYEVSPLLLLVVA